MTFQRGVVSALLIAAASCMNGPRSREKEAKFSQQIGDHEKHLPRKALRAVPGLCGKGGKARP